MLFKSSTTKRLWATGKKTTKKSVMFKPLKYHEQEVSSQPVSWQHLFSVLPSSLQTQKNWGVFSSSHSAGIQLGNTRSCSASSHEDGEGQESKRTNREEHRDTALGRLCTSHTENMHTHNEGFHCFLALFFVRVFFFLIKKKKHHSC